MVQEQTRSVPELRDGSEDTVEDPPRERRSGGARLAAAFRVRYQSLEDFVVAYSADISRGGLFLKTSNFLPIGSVIRLELALPDGGPTLRIIARVAFLRDAKTAAERGRAEGMGMEFLDVEGPALEEQLASFLSVRLREAAEPTAPPSRILVVDDDDAYRLRATELLEAQGHEIESARNGLEALSIALRDPPDMILTDVQMPTMDGWQLLRLVRAQPSVSHVPVVFFTTLGGEAERLKGYRLGVDDYIAKPFGDGELTVRVTKILSRSLSRPRTTASKNALRGDLSQVCLQSVLSFIEMEKRSGTLMVVSDEKLATLHIREGDVVRVDVPRDAGDLEGIDRLLHVLDWTDGRFELSGGEVTCVDEIGMPTGFVLLEHARRTDERDA